MFQTLLELFDGRITLTELKEMDDDELDDMVKARQEFERKNDRYLKNKRLTKTLGG